MTIPIQFRAGCVPSQFSSVITMKNLISDIKVSDRRSVRRIPLPENRRRNDEAENDEPLLYQEDRTEPVEIVDGSWSKIALWLAVGVGVAVLLIVFSWAMTGATVAVTPKSAVISLVGDFEAHRKGGEFSFVSAPFEKNGEQVVPAIEQKRIAERASGTIVVYNNFSDRPQRLIKNTRFESPEGRIYRIDRSIVVPGQKKEESRLVPGSVEAVVFADSPGDAFNSPLTDFTVPGFKNDPARYAAFYARSKTPLAGGFEGVVRVPAEAVETAARENIRARVMSELITQAAKAVPEGFIFFPSAYRIADETLPNEERSGSEVAVREKLALTAFYLPRAGLAAIIAREKLPQYDGTSVSIPALESLSFELQLPSSTAEQLSFSLAGEVRIVSLFDAPGLAEALRGRPKSDVAKVLSSFPAIEKVDVTLRPFWRRSFPEKAGKIKIEVGESESAR